MNRDSTKKMAEQIRNNEAEIYNLKNDLQKICYMFYRCIEGDMNDPTDALELMEQLGFVNGAYEWNYDE